MKVIGSVEPCFAPIDRAGIILGRGFLQSIDMSSERFDLLRQ
jgi:hypothetical protein